MANSRGISMNEPLKYKYFCRGFPYTEDAIMPDDRTSQHPIDRKNDSDTIVSLKQLFMEGDNYG